MSSSLNIGTTGLSASEKQMDVIGNNLANANTVGFKAADTYFASMLSQSLSGGGGSNSVGQGVGVAAVSTVFAQGTFESTGNVTDVAIDGNGFFIAKDKDGNFLYTRAGGFHISNDGLLTDINKYNIQGHMFDSDGVVEDQTMSALNLQNAQSKPSASTYFAVGMTLDSQTAVGCTFNSSQVVYDSLGEKHNLNTTFTKMEDPKYWALQASLDDAPAISQTYSGLKFDANGAIDKVYTAGLAAAPTITGAGGGTAAATINNVGTLYKSTTAATGPIILTRGTNADTWTITGNGGYASDALTLGTMGVDDTIGVDLDGVGGSDKPDIQLDLTGTWAAGDTISFDIIQTEAAPVNIDVRFGTNGGASTRNQYDLAIEGGGFFQIENNGQTSYTKVGDFSPNKDGVLCYSGGLKLLPEISIPQGTVAFTVDSGGTWTAVDGAGAVLAFGRIELANFANTAGLKSLGNNLYDKTNISGEPIVGNPYDNGFGTISQGSVSMLNVGAASPGKLGDLTFNLVGLPTHGAPKIKTVATTSRISSLENDGYALGILTSLAVGKDGIVEGMFSNGQRQKLARMLLADFANLQGLNKVGSYFIETADSGPPVNNKPGSGGLGELQSNSLEMSNTDTAKEFIKMITAQRAYQSSAKIIATADQMLQTLMNIKQ